MGLECSDSTRVVQGDSGKILVINGVERDSEVRIVERDVASWPFDLAGDPDSCLGRLIIG